MCAERAATAQGFEGGGTDAVPPLWQDDDDQKGGEGGASDVESVSEGERRVCRGPQSVEGDGGGGG